jgi:hypothetical protein
MSRTGRNSLLVLVIGVLVAGLSMMALAAEEDDGAADEGTTTTIADTGLIPAVQMDSGDEAPAQADWTYRYLIPTGLALAAIIVLVTAVKYFTDVVRKRYRIIEE